MPLPLDSAHFDNLARLMALEAREEAARLQSALQEGVVQSSVERSGRSLARLVIREEGFGLGGHVLVRLGKRSQGQPLPFHRFRVGAPILLSEETGAATYRGVVSQADKETIQVALGQFPEADSPQALFRLDISGDEITRQRSRSALAAVRTAANNRLAELRQVLLGAEPALFEALTPSFSPLNPALDASQRAAVAFALASRDVAIIHGPPGTGKTTTIVEYIQQAVRQGKKVFACAPSNLGVDNILERLVSAGEKVIRLGHPARVLPGLVEHTLDVVVEKHPDYLLAEKYRRTSLGLLDRADRFTRARPLPGEKKALRQEARDLKKEALRLENQAVEQILDRADIICATLAGVSPELLGGRIFDVCVMDEACQSVEPESWIPITRCRQVVFAGDHFQLPPTILSREAEAQGFGVSLMERLMHTAGESLARQLTVQYRMHEDIMRFSSRVFYHSTLQADITVAQHLLAGLPGVQSNELTTAPVTFIDTAGASYDEEREPGGESRFNIQEAHLAAKKVKQLLDAGLPSSCIAVITPYSAQVSLLRELLPDKDLEIDSVDGIQGREKEAVVISLVRSNTAGEIGFLADTRRMNVALTRARRKLVVIGDSATISRDPFYEALIAYFEEIGAYHSVWEET